MTLSELNRLRYLVRDIRRDEQRLHELRELRDAGGPGGVGGVGGRTGPGDPTGRLAAAITSLEMGITLDTARKLLEEQRLREFIEACPDAMLRAAMKSRFISCRSWAATARDADPTGINTPDGIRMAINRYIQSH